MRTASNDSFPLPSPTAFFSIFRLYPIGVTCHILTNSYQHLTAVVIMGAILMVLVLVLLLGGGGGYYGYGLYGGAGLGGAFGMVLVVLLACWFFGVIGGRRGRL
jgi:hypothetical protein